jgi:hypothetical protein
MTLIAGSAKPNAATNLALLDGFKTDLGAIKATPKSSARQEQPTGVATLRQSSGARAEPASLKSQTADPAITRGTAAQAFTMQDFASSKYKLGKRFDKLVDSSASLREALKELQSRGFRIEMGSSTFTNMKQKTVTLARAEFLRLDHLASSLSHELGHVTNAARYVDFKDRNCYIQPSLAGESAAVLFNLKVRQELLNASKGDVGVLGQPAFGKQAVEDWNSAAAGRISLSQLKEKLAAGYATQRPQVAPDQNYAQFFGTEFDSLTRYNPDYVGKIFKGEQSDGI